MLSAFFAIIAAIIIITGNATAIIKPNSAFMDNAIIIPPTPERTAAKSVRKTSISGTG